MKEIFLAILISFCTFLIFISALPFVLVVGLIWVLGDVLRKVFKVGEV